MLPTLFASLSIQRLKYSNTNSEKYWQEYNLWWDCWDICHGFWHYILADNYARRRRSITEVWLSECIVKFFVPLSLSWQVTVPCVEKCNIVWQQQCCTTVCPYLELSVQGLSPRFVVNDNSLFCKCTAFEGWIESQVQCSKPESISELVMLEIILPKWDNPSISKCDRGSCKSFHKLW